MESHVTVSCYISYLHLSYSFKTAALRFALIGEITKSFCLVVCLYDSWIILSIKHGLLQRPLLAGSWTPVARATHVWGSPPEEEEVLPALSLPVPYLYPTCSLLCLLQRISEGIKEPWWVKESTDSSSRDIRSSCQGCASRMTSWFVLAASTGQNFNLELVYDYQSGAANLATLYVNLETFQILLKIWFCTVSGWFTSTLLIPPGLQDVFVSPMM